MHFDEAQLAIFAADNSAKMMAGIKDELTIAAGKVTPGVDDTPYLLAALDALNGNRDSAPGQFYPSGTSASYPDESVQERRWPTYSQPPPAAVVEDQAPPPPAAQRPISPEEAPRDTKHYFHQPPSSVSRWLPVDKVTKEAIAPKEHTHPPLTYKPRILRPFSMLILMAFSLFMIAALIFSAIYSDKNHGLTPYPGSIYSGQYFVFRILPQLLAAIILVYAQCIVTASFRILPFCCMASEEPQKRQFALFQRLYPRSFLWPQMAGPWQVKLFGVATWLANFTIPLQSTAFTCILVKDNWVWAAVPGVAWTLVALYIILLVSTITIMTFWFRRWTGLVWDMRSIGDLVPLLHHSNTMESYEGLDLAPGGESFTRQLQQRQFDRLGYWQAAENDHSGAVRYFIGTSADPQEQQQHTVFNVAEKRISLGQSDGSHNLDVNADWYSIRHRYLPVALRTSTLVAFFSTTSVLLLALLIVSFLPQTRLDRGFYPLVSAKPSSGTAFSAANFLYGFVPSLLGMVLFLLFQSLDLHLRVLQPWADLAGHDHVGGGARARSSVLADYAACLPLQSTWRAATNGHWRVAVVSLAALLFLAVPVLAGGLFMALTNARGEVRMFPNMPVFGVLVAFLCLYVGCLSLLLPRRRQLRLPHPVVSLAELISFCTASETYLDDAFRNVRSRRDLEGRLCLDEDNPLEERRWFFGNAPGREENRWSIRRPGRFTEKRMRSPRSSN